jgi:hypothetical protein
VTNLKTLRVGVQVSVPRRSTVAGGLGNPSRAPETIARDGTSDGTTTSLRRWRGVDPPSPRAYFLATSGAGGAETARLQAARLGAFLERLDGFRTGIDPERVGGNATALRALEGQLGPAAPGPAPVRRRGPIAGEQWA